MIRTLIDKLNKEHRLTRDEYSTLLNTMGEVDATYLKNLARETSLKVHGNVIRIRGLIEISNVCRNNCLYCGIRAGNKAVERYRLTKEQIYECCATGKELGFQTFVLQGGEDPTHTKEWVADVVETIHKRYPDITITLSLGERPREDYALWHEKGAGRYLLRHETAVTEHYNKLHPAEMSLEARMQCLRHLKDIGYETGTGIMVGSPYQTIDNIVEDLIFIQEFKPEMIGIGPFLSHKDSPFHDKPNGDMELTIRLLAIFRLMHPTANIPATTSLGTISPMGREMGILAGANVVMPNLSPQKDRIKYSLYDNKISTNEEAAEGLSMLRAKMDKIGYTLL